MTCAPVAPPGRSRAMMRAAKASSLSPPYCADGAGQSTAGLPWESVKVMHFIADTSSQDGDKEGAIDVGARTRYDGRYGERGRRERGRHGEGRTARDDRRVVGIGQLIGEIDAVGAGAGVRDRRDVISGIDRAGGSDIGPCLHARSGIERLKPGPVIGDLDDGRALDLAADAGARRTAGPLEEEVLGAEAADVDRRRARVGVGGEEGKFLPGRVGGD